MKTKLYTELMSQHTEGDTVTTRERVNLAEKHLNAAANQMVRTFNFGQEWSHEDRIKSASWAQFNKVPSLGGLVKTHKEELKLRPVCYAKCNQCPNGPLACLLCVALDPFIDGADRDQRTEVESTEELCHEIGVANQRITRNGPRKGSYQGNGKLEVGSLDVKNFYPSIDVNVAAEEVKEEILESEVEVNGVNYEEAALFIACTLTQDEIDKEGLTHVIHRRKCINGRRPGITCKAITGGPLERMKDGSWLPPSRLPARRQKKRIIACVIKEVIKLVMNNHFYCFNNNIYRQESGAGIGNQASEKLGKLLMKRFDRKFLLKLKKLKIELDLYKRYVDDVTAALASLQPGMRFEENKMILRQDLVEEDKMTKSDKRTMEELAKIAGSVYECLNFTSDCPSSQEEGKVPVLDLKLYVSDQGNILHEFYEKPVACKLVIPEESAHSWRMKVAVMVEEGMRRLRNHSRGLEWQISRKCMVKWALKLKRSGYNETFRHQVIKAALDKWRKMCDTEDSGGRPIHRPRDWRRRERKLAKESKRQSWHKGGEGQVSAPLILDPVSGSMVEDMKAECDKFERMHGIRVQVCQRAGKSVRTDAKSEPLRITGCEREQCLPCQTGGERKGDCEKNSVTYEITCETCLLAGRSTTYEGETGRNAFTRGLEHQQGLRQKSEQSALWKHCVLEHSSQEAEFSMKIIQSHTSSLCRQVHEAVRISRTQAEVILNSKSEFHQAPLVRVVAMTGLQEDQSPAAGQGAGGRGQGVGAGAGERQGTRGRGLRGGRGGRSRARGGGL